LRKIKHNIDIIIQYDTRENNIDYIDDIRIDKRRAVDGIKILGIERVCVKPDNCKISTGDITFKYRLEGSVDWKQSNLAIELKKGTDIMSSTYLKKNRERLYDEINRAKQYKLDFYLLITDDITKLNNKINLIRRFNDKACIITFNNLLKLDDFLIFNGFRACLCVGDDIGWTIRRLIKNNIVKNKLMYG
jgi:hypothetical protein